MKKIQVPVLKEMELGKEKNLRRFVNSLEKYALEYSLWNNGQETGAKVFFSLAHDEQALVAGFFVEEEEVRAQVTGINGPVWEDSCVEFFLSFDGVGYYNFEFNPLGAIYGGYGENREGRTVLPEEVLRCIGTQVRQEQKGKSSYWEIIILLPLQTFVYHPALRLSGRRCIGNFYKCGDRLSKPHYLAWSPVRAEEPNFHLPRFFGEIYFQ